VLRGVAGVNAQNLGPTGRDTTKSPTGGPVRRFAGVEMAGIEPASDAVLSGLLRAQFASVFLGFSHRANKWLPSPVV